MRILLHSRVFPPAVGGMERFAELLASSLAAAGHDVTVVTDEADKSPRDIEYPFRLLRAPGSWAVRAELRRSDVVHVSGVSVGGVAAAVAAFRRPVVTHHAYQALCALGVAWSKTGPCSAGPAPGPCAFCPRGGTRGRVAVTLYRAAARRAACNACISHYQRDRLGLPRSRVLWNPVDPRAFAAHTAAAGDEGRVVFAGRLVVEKGLDVLLRALAMVPGVKLDVVGDGYMRGEWERLAQDLGVAGRAQFRGQMSFEGVAEAYAAAALVVVPSTWAEPFGYAAAEAMAMGRPVLATPVGAMTELLEGGRGFLAPGPTPDALASAIRAALASPASLASAGAAARTFSLEHLSPDAAARRYLSVYGEVAGRT